jgi:hypothetical protein
MREQRSDIGAMDGFADRLDGPAQLLADGLEELGGRL